MNPENARFLVEHYARLMEQEFPATVKVLAAVKDDNRDYRPDAKSRTAWELATHLATADIWFLDSIINGSFAFDPEAASKAEAQFKSVNDLVEFYKKAFPARLEALRKLPADAMTRMVDFFGMFQAPAVAHLGMANNHGIHHRGQLASYLRAHGSKVPAIYGGSADEPFPTAAAN
jgi:uncharacterized damage-inducible protein DinB